MKMMSEWNVVRGAWRQAAVALCGAEEPNRRTKRFVGDVLVEMTLADAYMDDAYYAAKAFLKNLPGNMTVNEAYISLEEIVHDL